MLGPVAHVARAETRGLGRFKRHLLATLKICLFKCRGGDRSWPAFISSFAEIRRKLARGAAHFCSSGVRVTSSRDETRVKKYRNDTVNMECTRGGSLPGNSVESCDSNFKLV